MLETKSFFGERWVLLIPMGRKHVSLISSLERRLHRISQDIPEAAEDGRGGGGGWGEWGLLSAQQLHFHLQQKGSVDQT